MAYNDNVVFKTSTTATIDDLFVWNKATGSIEPKTNNIPIVPGTVYFTADGHIVHDLAPNQRVWMSKEAYSAIYAKDIEETHMDLAEIIKYAVHYVTATGIAAVTSSPYTHTKWDIEDSSISELYDGLTIRFKVPIAGNGSYGTAIKINNGTYHPVVFNVNSMIGTRYGANSTITLTYNSNVNGTLYSNSASSSSISGVWQIEDYDATNIYQLRTGYARVLGPSTEDTTATKSLYRYQLLIEDKNGKLIPFNFINNQATTYTKVLNKTPFNPFSPIFYYSATTTVAVNGSIAANTLYQQVLADLRFSFNINSGGTAGTTALIANQPIYIKALYDYSSGTATFVQDLSNSNYLIRSSLTQSLPTTNPNVELLENQEYIYIYLGNAYDKYRVDLNAFIKQVYHWDNNYNICNLFSSPSNKIKWSEIQNKPNDFTPSIHTHATSIATDSGTNQLTLAYNQKYKLTTGGTNFIFTMPSTNGTWSGNAVTASAITQNATNSNNINYRILLSGSAANNAETTSLNKSSNLIYNPSTNKLSTGNIDVGGNINITGNANLNGETLIDSATVGNILINGSASFVQSPVAPTPTSGDSSTKLATTAFVSNAINQGFAINDAMVFKGVIGSNQIITSLPTQGYNAGWTYRVADAGTYAGEYCEVGDLIIAIKDGPASGSSVVNTDWAKIEHNIDGAVFRGAGASNNSVGSGTQPVYVNSSGIVTPTTYSLAKSVPSNAEFTDNKVTQNSSSANGWRKILLNGDVNNYSSSDWQNDTTAQTSEVYQSKYLSANPSNGSLSAKRYYVRGSANSNNYIYSESTNQIYLYINGVVSLTATDAEIRRGSNANFVNLGSSTYPWNSTYSKNYYIKGSANSNNYISSNAADNLYFMIKSTATNTDICTLVLKGKTGSTTETTVKPGQGTTVDLGTSSDKWNALYIKNLQVPSSGTITASLPIKVEHIANNGREFEITYNDTIDFALMVGAGNINHGLYDYKKNSGAWILSADSTHNWILNGSASKWTTARTITKAGDLQGEFSLDGSGNVTDTTYINYIRAIRNNSNSSYCYHRILRTNGKISSEYYDASAILILNQGFVGGNYGIARVALRTNRITTNPAAPSVEITWLVRKGFSIDALQFGLINDNGKAIADIYLKETTPYGGTFIRVLQDFRSTPENRWIKVNSSAIGSGSNGTNTTNTEVYTSVSSPYTETENGVTTTIPYTSTSTSDVINATKDTGIVQTISSTLTVNKGGTGQTSLAENKILIGNGTNAIKTTSLEVDNEGNLSNTKTNQADLSYSITNNRGSIGLRVAENRGLFDYTQNKWIIYKLSTSTGTDNVGQTLIPSWASKGSTSMPVYFNNIGEPVGITSFTTNYVLVGNGTNGIKASSKLQIPVNDTGTITALLPVSISGKLQILNENNSNYSVGSGHLIIGGKTDCNYNATLEMQMGALSGKSWQFSVENYQGSDGSFVIRNNYLGESPGYNNLYNNTTNNSSKTVLDINFATYNTTLKGALSINNGLTIAGYIPYILFSDTQNSPSSKWKIKASGTLLKFLSGDNDKERINFITGDNSFAINPADISNNNTLGNSDNRWSSTYLRENIYIGQNNNEVILQYDSTNKTLNFIFN